MAATLVLPMLPTPAGPVGGQRTEPGHSARVLVTNADGVSAPGLRALATAAALLGHDVVIAAASSDRCGSGAAIGPSRGPQLVRQVPMALSKPGRTIAFAVDGPPALAVILAAQGAFGTPPDIVVSGVNAGLNTGVAILHSGTVGAAVTAANLGLRGLAVSMATGEPTCLDTAGIMASCALVLLGRAPAGTALNLNVPNVAVDELRGIRWAPLAAFGSVRAVTRTDGDHVVAELHSDPVDAEAGTDTALVAGGYATITSVVGLRAADHSAQLAEQVQ